MPEFSTLALPITGIGCAVILVPRLSRRKYVLSDRIDGQSGYAGSMLG